MFIFHLYIPNVRMKSQLKRISMDLLLWFMWSFFLSTTKIGREQTSMYSETLLFKHNSNSLEYQFELTQKSLLVVIQTSSKAKPDWEVVRCSVFGENLLEDSKRDIFVFWSNIAKKVGVRADLTTRIENNKWSHLALFVG